MGRSLTVLVAILLPILLGCKPQEIIQSKWTAPDSLLAADTSRWKGQVQYPDDPQFGVGARNDSKYLYLCLTSWKQDVNRRILRYGFTTWFTSKSKKRRLFGIHFPVGQTAGAPGGGWRHHNGGQEAEGAPQISDESLQQMELLGPEKSDSVPVKTSVALTFGIVVKMFPTYESLVYLLKVPLNSDSVNKYAMDIGSDTLISLKCATDVPDITSGREGGEGGTSSHAMGGSGGGGMHGRGGGGMHGGGGGMHGGGGGRSASTSQEQVDSFTAGFTIRLAGHQ
ncbi:MAG TPA: hypothetical protein VLX68_02270 [Chitinivibrionales bacterium]|nr:hypothetical protein [Chitinivibrionales bacterium]